MFNKTLMKIKALIALSFFVVTILLFSPLIIGKWIEKKIYQKIEIHNSNTLFPHIKINYKRGWFHSSASIEITSRASNRSPVKYATVTEEIFHGPIVFDLNQHVLNFSLAKINIHATVNNSQELQINQPQFSPSVVINYLGKAFIKFQTNEISGIFSTNIASPLQFAFSNVELNQEHDLKNSNSSDINLTVNEITLTQDDKITKLKNIIFKGKILYENELLKINNKFLDIESLYLTGPINLHINNIQFNHTSKKQPDPSDEYYQIRTLGQFQACKVDNVDYGSMNYDFQIDNLSLNTFSEYVFLNVKEIKSLNALLEFVNTYQQSIKKELQFNLNTLRFVFPEGKLALNGQLLLSANDTNIPKEQRFYGKLNASLSKALKSSTFANIFNSVPFSELLLVDAEDSYESYMVYKNNNVYINGNTFTDPSSVYLPPALLNPRTNEQKLLTAIWYEDCDKAKKLLEASANPNFITPQQQSLLSTAALMGSEEIANLLMDYKANVNQINDKKTTALYWASRANQFKIAKLLLNKGADPNLSTENESTPLLEAAANGNFLITHLLLENGAHINHVDNEGRTALFQAAKNGHAGIVELLLRYKGDLSITTVQGKTALDAAKEEGHKITVEILNFIPFKPT